MSDTKEFIETLREYQIKHSLFDENNEVFITRAPGRLDVMGGIADYSGSLTLEMPVAEAAFAALQKQNSQSIEIISLNSNDNQRTNQFRMDLADFWENECLLSYEKASRFLVRIRAKVGRLMLPEPFSY